MGLFSGDGAGCSARLLKKYGAKVVGGLHIRMPDSVCDVKLLKKSVEQNKKIVKAADKKIEKTATRIKTGNIHTTVFISMTILRGLSAKGFGAMGKQRIMLMG